MGQTLLLTRGEIRRLLSLKECIQAVDEAFRLYAEGRTLSPGVLGIPSEQGGFHIKAAGMKGFFATKVNANFPGNRSRYNLPTIQGLILLCDAKKGEPLAVMDSMEITALRTAAATAVAARYLATKGPHTVTIAGCGSQGQVQLRALMSVCDIGRVFAFDSNPASAQEFVQQFSAELQVDSVTRLDDSIPLSSIVVTCTTSKKPIVQHVSPGTLIAAVGADSHDKQELDPMLFLSSKIVTDITEQCANIGDLHHAIHEGLVTKEKVHAELGEIVSGKKPGRESEEEVIIFDSTGTALQDVAAAILVYEKAKHGGVGMMIDFAL